MAEYPYADTDAIRSWPALWERPKGPPTPASPPLWEQGIPQTAEELVKLICVEAWIRSQEPSYTARLAEAELACLRSGSRAAAVYLDDLRNEELDIRADQAATIGFYLAATVAHAEKVEEWCQAAMNAAGIRALSVVERAIYEARRREAFEAKKRIPKRKKGGRA